MATSGGSLLLLHRWRPLAATTTMLGMAALAGVIVARLELGTSPLSIALLGAALAVACLWIVVRSLDNRAGIAATSEATFAALAFLLLPLNAVRLSASATVGDLFLLVLSIAFVARLATGRALGAPPGSSLPSR